MAQMVAYMLSSSIITPSASPYLSPVYCWPLLESSILLVKKKDAGWRFCVDYVWIVEL